ncbi:MAG TPA: ferritin-like domain-containing protein [Candidatus Binataceae bacterium]|nr:ferritin-like domain-containing protein [Candidatus Binataceae bacterium]
MGVLNDVAGLRQRALKHIEAGAVTDEYNADRAEVVATLNTVLATELMCALRYKRHYYTATGLKVGAVKQEFLEHAQEAQQHADRIAERIVELNGTPDFNPESLTARSLSQYTGATTIQEMIREDLIAERIAVESYSEIVRWLGENDVTTRKLMADILSVEEQHAADMQKLFNKLPLRE